MSPNKTAGRIQLKDLKPEDVSAEPYTGRDAIIVIEGEMRQFEKGTTKVQRYVESLVTGRFMPVQKEVNLQGKGKSDEDKS